MYQLFYYPNNASLAPHFLLHHMRQDYELVLVDRNVNHQKSKEYLRLNPSGRIPTLVDNGQPIFESAAICIHLCEQHPEFDLIPKLGSSNRPLFFQWLAYLSNTLQPELMIRYYPHRHTDDKANIENIVNIQDKRIAECLALIDNQLGKSNYLAGETLSACDYYLFMLSEWSLPLEQSPMTFPHLSKYLQHLSLLPSIRDVCAKEDIDLSPFAT